MCVTWFITQFIFICLYYICIYLFMFIGASCEAVTSMQDITGARASSRLSQWVWLHRAVHFRGSQNGWLSFRFCTKHFLYNVVATWVQSQGSPCGICSEQVTLALVSIWVLPLSYVSIIPAILHIHSCVSAVFGNCLSSWNLNKVFTPTALSVKTKLLWDCFEQVHYSYKLLARMD
jgi:hypothetical protein